MIKDAYPLPRVSSLIDKLRGKTHFTKMDVRWGYNNIRIAQEDKWKAAFTTKYGLFQPTVDESLTSLAVYFRNWHMFREYMSNIPC